MDELIPLTDRFWSKVRKPEPGDASTCWIWTGAKVRGKYGKFYVGSKPGHRAVLAYAHRLVLEEKLGRKLLRGKEACHNCDVPSCVNPEHLFEATHWENEQDKKSKGRTLFGERNGLAKLTDIQATEVAVSPLGNSELASRFGVTRSAIQLLRNGQSWTHLGVSAESRAASARRRGSGVSLAKLSETEAVAIYKSDGSAKDIARTYGVSYETVRSIKRGRTWKHVTNQKDVAA